MNNFTDAVAEFKATVAEIKAEELLCTQLQAQFDADVHAARTTNNPMERAVLCRACDAGNHAIALAIDRIEDRLVTLPVVMFSRAMKSKGYFSSKTVH